jgi:hypothetical protein
LGVVWELEVWNRTRLCAMPWLIRRRHVGRRCYYRYERVLEYVLISVENKAVQILYPRE